MEVISVVTTSVIIDTLHQAMGLPLAPLPKAQPGEPRGQYNADAVDMGAWVPIMQAPTDLASHGLPNVPNIVRSMGLVPSAVELFFTAFTPLLFIEHQAVNIPSPSRIRSGTGFVYQ